MDHPSYVSKVSEKGHSPILLFLVSCGRNFRFINMAEKLYHLGKLTFDSYEQRFTWY
ncbi:hypothetical protein PORUE0001_1042 [Porphyromonas uenonis 60-3]|uniref:Uncharacterized protein n=1 Tax=Porphyromonas uenonis 60-3 TaxID=596327 RepID=C2MB29_9PORP|nr:hypothetical protein PORUE0001_1042 [Porphyromonas uenonis 60-3]